MTLLIVYEDETPYNPIVFTGIVGNTTMTCHDDNEIETLVRKAIDSLGINNADIDNIVYDLLRIDGFTWVDEHWCFALKEV